MSEGTWRKTKLGSVLEEGLLRIFLYEDGAGWNLNVYLRDGVQVGELRGGDQIAHEVPASAPPGVSEDIAQEQAADDAEAWLLTHANELLKAKREEWIPGVGRPAS